jgi:ABC-2 type transport system permease protein/oleandomycin transport system permease protein
MSAAAPSLPPLAERSIDTRKGVGLGWAIRDNVAMTWRNLTVIRRVPQLLVFALVQPLIFVLMFRFVFGGAIAAPGGIDYVNYLMPGIFVQTVVFGAINTAVGLAEDRTKGLLERLKSLPMARSAVLGGRVAADSVRNFVTVVLMIVVGYIVDFRPTGSFLAIFAAILVMVMFGLSMCWIFAVIGLTVPNGEAAQAAAFPLIAPLVFASNAFVPVDTMPSWLQWWAERQPVSVTVNAVRALMIDYGSTDYVWASLAWSFGIMAVMAPIAIRKYRKA